LTTFLDTSAVLAFLDADDPRQPQADALWKKLFASTEELVSTNYVLVETFALVQRRLGMEAVRSIQREIVPILEIEWLDGEMHRLALNEFLAASRRHLSLVDCASFEVMRRRGIRRVFAFDGHFSEYGFEPITE